MDRPEAALSLDAWLDRQAEASARGLAACISATGLVKHRTGFGQVMRPAPGSVLASPSVNSREGEPDYFFHWLRDAAVVMDAARLLALEGDRTADWTRLFAEWVGFSLALGAPGEPLDRARVAPALVQFLRPEAELPRDSVLGDVRFNPDGTLDRLRWSRPQHDGPALEALVALRWVADGLAGGEAVEALVRRDLDYTAAHLAALCYDIWEEGLALHYYTLLVQRAALAAGGAGSSGPSIDGFWQSGEGFNACSIPPGAKPLDMQVILAVLHAEVAPDARVLATLRRLEAHFATAYPLNRGRALFHGRYPGDRYVTGGPWYITTFAAAELRYRTRDPALVAEADLILEAVRATIPPDGRLSEQIDPVDGTQASARDLAWSHAAFLTARAARRAL